jgi:CheY-like chemotaxis protein
MDEKKKIYMVDDDADLVDAVKWVLEARGYAFASAASGEEAIANLDAVKPDLVILDVMMEDVVAGFRVVSYLRDVEAHPENRKYANLPILMMTSIQQKTKMRFSDDAGSRLLPIDAFLEKPVKPQLLLETLARLLAQN